MDSSNYLRKLIIFISLLFATIRCDTSDYIRLSGGFVFVDQGKCGGYLATPSNAYEESDTTGDYPKSFIEPHIVDYKYDDNFITVCQEDEKSCKCFFYENKRIKSVVNYYVYDIKKLKKMGPMDKSEFDKLKKRLGIGDDLEVDYIPFEKR